MHPRIFRLALSRHNARSDTSGFQCTLNDVPVAVDLAASVWEGQPKLTIWASKTPRSQHRHHRFTNRYSARACHGLSGADLIEAVGTLADVYLASPQVHVFPAKAPKLRDTQPSKGGSYEQRTNTHPSGSANAADFIRRGDMYANLQLCLLALFDSIVAPPAKLSAGVLT
jgi:hypothetical protein